MIPFGWGRGTLASEVAQGKLGKGARNTGLTAGLETLRGFTSSEMAGILKKVGGTRIART